MYKTIIASLVSVFAFASIACAQSVPDLSSKNWKLSEEYQATLSVDVGNGQTVGLSTTAKFYENETDKMFANVLMWKDSEVAMIFGTESDYTYAIKVDNKWYVAKDKDQKAHAAAVYDSDGKPSGVRLTLETTDGLKELVLNLP